MWQALDTIRDDAGEAFERVTAMIERSGVARASLAAGLSGDLAGLGARVDQLPDPSDPSLARLARLWRDLLAGGAEALQLVAEGTIEDDSGLVTRGLTEVRQSFSLLEVAWDELDRRDPC